MKPIKIVVFDLDETLGYFTELGLFWDSLIEYIKTEKQPSLFVSINNESIYLKDNEYNIFMFH